VRAAAKSSFVAWAAVDVLSGRALRLRRGREENLTDYGSAEGALTRWAEAGLNHLHVVDLGAAFGREPCLGPILRRAAREFPQVEFQAGGGVRDAASALSLAEAGAARVIVGTLLFDRPPEAAAVSDLLGTRAVAALDVQGGRIRVAGWTRDAEEDLGRAARLVSDMGYGEALVTDIERDGTGKGPNLALYASLSGCGLSILASGGVRWAQDLDALASMGHLSGAVVGRALYERTLACGEIREEWR